MAALEARPGGGVNRPGDTASGAQLRIGRVDDRVDVRLMGDVAADTFDRHASNASLHDDAGSRARLSTIIRQDFHSCYAYFQRLD